MIEEISSEESASATASFSAGLLTVDCGATGSLLSMYTLEAWEKSKIARVTRVDPTISKRYRVANGDVVSTTSQVEVHFAHAPSLGAVTFDVTEQEGVPSLLGMNFLGDSILNLERALTIRKGKITRLVKQPNGHLTVQLEPQHGPQTDEIDLTVTRADVSKNR